METPSTGSRLGYYDQVMDMLDKQLLEKGLISEENLAKAKEEREKNKNKPIDDTIEVTFLRNKNNAS